MFVLQCRHLHLIITCKGRLPLEPRALADQIVEWLAEKQAENIVLLDVSKLSLVVDYFVICNGTTGRQLGALLNELRTQAKQADEPLLRLEGDPQSGWIVADYGAVVVHLLSPELRAYYRLEDVWREARLVLRMP
ncbi:MAG: ribosome silencing factor [Chloroflexi bacterium]|nr:ribosome silencing factor [Chloroflexota bacterium]